MMRAIIASPERRHGGSVEVEIGWGNHRPASIISGVISVFVSDAPSLSRVAVLPDMGNTIIRLHLLSPLMHAGFESLTLSNQNFSASPGPSCEGFVRLLDTAGSSARRLNRPLTTKAFMGRHCLRLEGRRSVCWAIFNHDSAMRSQTALSLGLVAVSACWRHSSAFSRNSSAVLMARMIARRGRIGR
jgi:hypothetical protein